MTSTEHYRDEEVTLHLGNALDVLPTLPDASVDAIVCDPPYGLADHHPTVIAQALAAWLAGDRAHVPDGKGFMGNDWDRFVPPPAAWDECWRVLKPGGHLVAFAGARTADLMGLSIRLAGFDIRDSLHWIYGSGFPKGQDIAKSIDRRRDDREQILQVTAWLAAAVAEAGWTIRQVNDLFGYSDKATHWMTRGKAAAVPTPEQWARLRETVGFDDSEIVALVAELNGRKGAAGEAWAERPALASSSRPGIAQSWTAGAGWNGALARRGEPVLGDAQRWQGWKTQLKPAHEPIILARKSTGFNTTVANVLEHGTGALNIDGCRTPAGPDHAAKCASVVGIDSPRHGDTGGERTEPREDSTHPAGRWPTNVILTHPPLLGPDGEPVGDACADGCVPGCPVADMDRQSGHRAAGASPARRAGIGYMSGAKGTTGERVELDAGGASRFFPIFRYEAKAPASERLRLPDGTAHPTVKPLALMQWLIRLVTPPGGLVVDPFTGSGTTLAAAVAEGMRAIGIEQHQPYADLTVTRLAKPITLGLFGDHT